MLVAGILCRRWSLLAAPLVNLFTVARPIPCASRAYRFFAKVNVAIFLFFSFLPVPISPYFEKVSSHCVDPTSCIVSKTYTSVIIGIVLTPLLLLFV